MSGDDSVRGDVAPGRARRCRRRGAGAADAEALDAALEPTAKFGGHTGAVTCVCATESPRQQLASGSLDGTVMVDDGARARRRCTRCRTACAPSRGATCRCARSAGRRRPPSPPPLGRRRPLRDVRAPSPLAAQVRAPVALRSRSTAAGGGGGLFVGTEAGEVVELDCRSASCAVMRRAATFSAPVGSLAVGAGIVAAGADDGSVALLDVSNSLSTVRKFAPHTDFVRALCWLPRTDWPSRGRRAGPNTSLPHRPRAARPST